MVSVFNIIHHLNNGRTLIKTDLEKKQLFELNLIAGKKAKLAAAYDTALNYFKISEGMLSGDYWKNDYKRTLEIYNEIAEANYTKIQSTRRSQDFYHQEFFFGIGL